MDCKATICGLRYASEGPAGSSPVLPFRSVLPSPAMEDNAHLEAKPKVEAGYQVTLAELWRGGTFLCPLSGHGMALPLPFADPVGSSWVWKTD